MQSISSMKRTHGELSMACENISRILDSESPDTPDTSSGADTWIISIVTHNFY